MALYIAQGAPGTSAPFAPVGVSTSATPKTIIQLQGVATQEHQIVGWGISFATTPTAPMLCELFRCTASTLATVTAYTTTTLPPWRSNAPTTKLTLGTTGTGYNASGEGTLTAYVLADLQALTGAYAYQWPLAERPVIVAATTEHFRLRVTGYASSPNVFAYLIIEG